MSYGIVFVYLTKNLNCNPVSKLNGNILCFTVKQEKAGNRFNLLEISVQVCVGENASFHCRDFTQDPPTDQSPQLKTSNQKLLILSW